MRLDPAQQAIAAAAPLRGPPLDRSDGRQRVRRALPGAGRRQAGATVEESTANVREAVELFLECTDSAELARRDYGEVFVTRFDATVW